MLITAEIQVSVTGGSTVVNWYRVTSHSPRSVASTGSSGEPRSTERSYTLRFVTFAEPCSQNSGPTSQKRHCISITKTNQLMHYRKITFFDRSHPVVFCNYIILLLPIVLRPFQFGLVFPYNWCPFLSIQFFRSLSFHTKLPSIFHIVYPPEFAII